MTLCCVRQVKIVVIDRGVAELKFGALGLGFTPKVLANTPGLSWRPKAILLAAWRSTEEAVSRESKI